MEATRIACDGRILTWVPDIVVDYNDDCEQCLGLPACAGHSFDQNRPGEHEPRVIPPEIEDKITWIMTNGYICSWCNKRQASLMEAVTDNVMKESQLFKYFKRHRGQDGKRYRQ